MGKAEQMKLHSLLIPSEATKNGQKMAVLPDILQVPFTNHLQPFTNIGIDLCGSILVKPMTNKRATMNTCVCIFLCLNTKAVSLELATGYSTDDFLLVYSSHVNVRGIPSSDRGSQLVSAHKELAEDPLCYHWDLIAASKSHQGTSWRFAPAGGQWRNGTLPSHLSRNLSCPSIICTEKQSSIMANCPVP